MSSFYIDQGASLLDSGHCVYYGRYEIKSSDHRPVTCLIDINVTQVQPEMLKLVMEEEIQREVENAGSDGGSYHSDIPIYQNVMDEHDGYTEPEPVVPQQVLVPVILPVQSEIVEEYTSSEWGDPFGTVAQQTKPQVKKQGQGAYRDPSRSHKNCL